MCSHTQIPCSSFFSGALYHHSIKDENHPLYVSCNATLFPLRRSIIGMTNKENVI